MSESEHSVEDLAPFHDIVFCDRVVGNKRFPRWQVGSRKLCNDKVFFGEGGNAVDTKKFFRGGEKVLKNYRSFANSSVDGRMRPITLSPLRKVERTLIFLLAKVFLRARPPPSASLDDEINKAFWIHSRLSSMRTYHRKSRIQNDV